MPAIDSFSLFKVIEAPYDNRMQRTRYGKSAISDAFAARG